MAVVQTAAMKQISRINLMFIVTLVCKLMDQDPWITLVGQSMGHAYLKKTLQKNPIQPGEEGGGG